MGLGGARPGAGRPKGSKNRDGATELRKLARDFSQPALLKAAQLAGILPMKNPDGSVMKDAKGEIIYHKPATGETAQLTAINIILDRAYGKPKEVLEINDERDNEQHVDALTETIQSKLDGIVASGAEGRLPTQLDG